MGASLLHYEGNSPPSDPAYGLTPWIGASGTTEVEGGKLTIVNTASAGSIGFQLPVSLTSADEFAFSVRMQTVHGAPSSLPIAGVFRGGVMFLRWYGEDAGQLLRFVSEGDVLFDIDPFVNRRGTYSILPDAYNTFTISKVGDSVSLCINGARRTSRSVDEFMTPGSSSDSLFYFQGNPSSETEWDFVRFAQGEGALDLVLVPEPETALLLCITAGCGLTVLRRRAN